MKNKRNVVTNIINDENAIKGTRQKTDKNKIMKKKSDDGKIKNPIKDFMAEMEEYFSS
jgi:hypothetical protein